MLTNREFFEKVIALNDTELTEFAQNAISKLDAKNAKARDKRIENHKADEPIINAIVNFLKEHKTALANELAVACGVSTSKIVAVAKTIDCVKVERVKIPKVGERNQYSLTE